MTKLRKSRGLRALAWILSCLLLTLTCGNIVAFFALEASGIPPKNERPVLGEAVLRDQAVTFADRLLSLGLLQAARENRAEAWLAENGAAFETVGFTLKGAKDQTSVDMLSGNIRKDQPVYSFDFVLEEGVYSDGETRINIINANRTVLDRFRSLVIDTVYVQEENVTAQAPAEGAVPAEETTVPPAAEAEEPVGEPLTEPTAAIAPETTAPAQNEAPGEAASDVSYPYEDAAPTQADPLFGGEDNMPIEEGHSDVYIQDDREQGIATVFLYVFPENTQINQAIFEHCYDCYANQSNAQGAHYIGDYEIYFQDEFSVSANGVAYFIGNRHSQEEWFRITNNDRTEKTPDETHTYGLSLFFYEDTLADLNPLTALLLRLSHAGDAYLRHLIPFTVLFGVLGVALYLFTLWGAGYTRRQEDPFAGGIHKLPLDLALALCALYALAMFAIGDGIWDWWLGLWPAVLLTLAAVESLTVRIRAKTLSKNFICVKLWKLLRKALQIVSKNTSLYLKALLPLGLGELLLFLLLAANANNESLFVAIYLLAALFVFALAFILVYNFDTLQKGAENISKGRFKKVKNPLEFDEFKNFAGTLNHITDGLNRAVEARMKSERTKTELITNVSHDLKTPLTSIVTYIDLLKKEEIGNPKAKEYVDVIDRQAQRLKKLTTDVVDASKVAAGAVKAELAPTPIAILLSQVLGEYEEKLKEKQLTPILELPKEDVCVLADGQLLWRVFDNLMNNICKYAMPNTRVYLRADAEKDKVTVIFRNISNEALNIDPAELTDRFVRGDDARHTEGSGLGLYIAKNLTLNMGGTMDISIDGDLFKVTITFRKAG